MARVPWRLGVVLGACLLLVILASHEFLAIVPTTGEPCTDERVVRVASSGKVQGLVVVVVGTVLLLSSAVHAAIWARPVFVATCNAQAWVAGLVRWVSKDAESELVQQECDRLRVQLAHQVFNAMSCMFVPAGLSWSISLLTSTSKGAPVVGSGREMTTDEWHAWMIRDLGLPVWSLISVALTVVSAKPSLLTSGVVDCFLLMLTCAFLWWVCSTSSYNLLWLQARSMFVRTFQAMVCSNKFLLTGMLVVASVADTAVRYKHGIVHHGTVGDAETDFSHAALIVGLCWTLNKVLLLQARALVETRRCCSANALVHRLLDSMCDAVVFLDEDFLMRQPAPKLAGLLLHSGLPVQSFTDLMDPDDCKRFREHMAREASHVQLEEALPALALHVRLHDANGSNVPVELFCSCIPDANTGLLQYMVGVKEEGPRCEGAAELAESLGPIAPGVRDAIPENNSSIGSDDASDVSSLPDDTREMCAWVDPLDDDMRVLQHTPGFTALGGASTMGTELARWFEGNSRFKNLVEEKVNDWANSGREQNFTLAGVSFRPPPFKTFRIRLEGTVTFTLNADEGTEDQLARVSFFNVQARQKAPGRRWAGTPRVGRAQGPLRASRLSSGNAVGPRQLCRL